MLILKPLPFEPNPPVLGQAIPFQIEGKGYGILSGPPWLKITERKHQLWARRFGKAVVFRKTPVSSSRPDLPSLRRRPRLVKAGEVVWIIANKPKTFVTVKSLSNFKQHSITLNPKGVIANSPAIVVRSSHVKSEVEYDLISKSIHATLARPIVIGQPIKISKVASLNVIAQELIIKNTELNSTEINKLSQQNN